MFNTRNISGGGQVYDRTTGTWAGENTGNVGDDRSGVGRAARVIHDANGPVGIELAPARQVAAGGVQTRPGGGGTGPGAGAVTTAGPGAAGTGPGAAGVVTGGPLVAKMKPNTTSLMIGAPVAPNPWFSNADQWEERYGEPGDWIGGLVVAGADALHGIGFDTPKAGKDLWNAPGVIREGLISFAGYLDAVRPDADAHLATREQAERDAVWKEMTTTARDNDQWWGVPWLGHTKGGW